MKIIPRIGARTLAAVAGAAMLATVGAGAATAADWHYRGGDHAWHQGQGYWHNRPWHSYRNDRRDYDRRYYNYSPNRGYNYWNAPRGRDGRIDTKCPKYC